MTEQRSLAAGAVPSLSAGPATPQARANLSPVAVPDSAVSGPIDSPASPRGTTTADRVALTAHWRRWTAIVALFARRRASRHRIDPRAYAALRDDLIAACRSLAEADGEWGTHYTALEETVRPWVSPGALDRADPAILATLLSRCRAMERELSGRRGRPEWPSPLASARLLAAGAAGFALAAALLGLGSPVLAVVRDVFDTAWLTLKYSDDLLKVSATGVLPIAAAMWVISRTARS